MHRDGRRHGLEAELGIDRYMTYIVTRQVKSTQPSLLRVTEKTGN